jgi:hypothetical protein
MTLVKALLATGLVVACAGHAEQPIAGGSGPRLTAASAIVPVDERALVSLAVARCDRVERCNEIGEFATYQSVDECRQLMHAEAWSTLEQCQSGVDNAALLRCRDELRSMDCGTTVGRFVWVPYCRPDLICTPASPSKR